MENVKYEAVFGPQELFVTNLDHVYSIHADGLKIGDIDESEERFFFDVEGDLFYSSISDLLRKYHRVIFAMRRIIKEPKRWTCEDKKAGRLPEVGAILRPIAANPSEFIGVDIKNNRLWWFRYNGGVFSCLASRCEPIETPAEKAQRLEDEHLNMVAKLHPEFDIPTARAMYRMYLSGELAAPKGGDKA